MKNVKMETIMNRQSRISSSNKIKSIIVDMIAYLFVGIFIYTATGKFIKMDHFVKFMSRLDIIGPMGAFIAWAIPITEVVISILLLRSITRRKGLIASSVLMTLFTIYLIFMKLTAEHLPCHCGGVIALMTWTQHIYFNIALIILSIIGILLSFKIKNNDR